MIRNITGWCLLGTSLVGIMVYYVIPFGSILIRSFFDDPFHNHFVFWNNFVGLFHNEAFLLALKNTVLFAVTAVPVTLLLSLLMSLILEQKIPAGSFFRLVLLSPMMVPAASVLLIWQVLFDGSGVLAGLFQKIGAQPIDWFHSSWSLLMLTIFFVWKNLGYLMLFFTGTLSGVPSDLREQARADGAGSVTVFFRITLHYILPGLIFALVLELMGTFKIFREVYLLVGDYPPPDLYFLQHFMTNQFRRLDYALITSSAVVFSLLLLGIMTGLFLLEDRMNRDLEG